MILYHISLNLENEVEKFIPRLPSAVYEGEDSTTRRISVSSSIEGALTSVPFGGRRLEVTQCELADSHGDDEVLFIRVFEFDSEKIKEENLFSPNKLWLEGFVPDAEVCEEYWIVNQEVAPVKTYIAEITSYHETVQDVFDPIVETGRISNEDFYDYLICSPTKIVDIELNKYPSLTDLPVEIDMRTYNKLLFQLRINNFEGL